jgi:hypothetical protein
VESESQELGERSQGPGQLEGGAGPKAGGKHLHWVQGPVKHDVPHLPVVVSLLALLAPRRMLIKGACATQCQNDLAVIEWAPPLDLYVHTQLALMPYKRRQRAGPAHELTERVGSRPPHLVPLA